jgi:hypothetical protein
LKFEAATSSIPGAVGFNWKLSQILLVRNRWSWNFIRVESPKVVGWEWDLPLFLWSKCRLDLGYDYCNCWSWSWRMLSLLSSPRLLVRSSTPLPVTKPRWHLVVVVVVVWVLGCGRSKVSSFFGAEVSL